MCPGPRHDVTPWTQSQQSTSMSSYPVHRPIPPTQRYSSNTMILPSSSSLKTRKTGAPIRTSDRSYPTMSWRPSAAEM